MRRKKQKSKNQKLSSLQLQSEILQIFKDNPRKRYNPRQISKKLGMDNNKDSVLHALSKMTEAGQLQTLEDFKFKLRRAAAAGPRRLYEGIVDMTRTGTAYIECKGEEDDIFVSAANLGTALHGDLVQVAGWRPRGRRRPEGEVIKVLERATEQFVGTLHYAGELPVVLPVGDHIPMEIQLSEQELQGAGEGEKVVVRITRWHKHPGQRPEGRITSVLGKAGSDLDMKVILINNGFDLHFPPEVLAESESFAAHIPLPEIHRRLDLRQVTTFTIDPVDAKDFDDALSIRKLPNGNTEIGVHIADVTHYVQSGTALDREAYHRSTSVYLVDRVLPMLPERLSNDLCSLRPNEDKLTFSALFEFDPSDNLLRTWFGKTVIHSDQRFTYEEAEARLVSGKGSFARELKQLNRTARKLREMRFKQGSIDFDVEEVRFRLDEEGVPVEVYVKERLQAHQLIEDLMLLANREVARYIHKKGTGEMEVPFVYRVHDFPDPEKVREFALFAKTMGIQLKTGTPAEIAASFNRLVTEAATNESVKLLLPIAIRTMAKAAYSTENIGHYGLGFEHYTHFTSPIRRYADVLVHRILEQNLENDTWRTDGVRLHDQCRHISLQERKAMQAERESIRYKQVEYIKRHIGDTFVGLVSGIIERGFFVELTDNKCEGMVPFHSLPEAYLIEDSRLVARGMRSGRVLKIGELVRVRILSADLERRQIEMELISNEMPPAGTGRR